MRVFLICFFFASPLFAASGWIGSGGELFRNANNPWWLFNKKEIRYCVVYDSNSMSSTQAKAEDLVKSVFKNWIDEWKFFFKNSNEKILFGEQKLKKVDCENLDEPQDISFNFGWGSLNDQQKKFIKKSKNKESIVGLTVRTHYDPKKMMGQGFIYIASDMGPNRFSLGQNMYEKPWRHQFLLSMVLAHEIGHTFGVRHTKQFSGLMSESAFELFLSKEIVKAFEPALNTKFDFHFFSRKNRLSVTADWLTEKTKKFLNVFDKSNLEMVKENSVGEYSLFETTEFGTRRKVLSFKMMGGTHNIQTPGSETSTIFLDPEQTLFDRSLHPLGRVYILTNPHMSLSGIGTNHLTGQQHPFLLIGNSESMTLHHYAGDDHIEVELDSSLYGVSERARKAQRAKPRKSQ